MNHRNAVPNAALVAFCRGVDRVNDAFSAIAAGAVLAACLISAGNALVRYGWNTSSNAWLEIQWYLFATTVMLGAAHVLRRNEHVRVDIFYARLSPRWAALLDIAGLVLFLMPVMVLLAALSWPVFARALASGEVSSNAGGLVRWPALLLLPLGFALVSLQGVAEIVKRVLSLRNAQGGLPGGTDASDIPGPARYEKPLQ